MSAAEKPVLTSVPVQPATSVHEVQPQPAPTPHGKPWWQKLAVPALVLVQEAVHSNVVRMQKRAQAAIGAAANKFRTKQKVEQVVADERRFANMKVGDLAELRLDTYPGKVFS